MQRRTSMTPERFEVALHDAADFMGQGKVPRSEKWARFYLQALATPDDKFEALMTEFGIPHEMADITKEIVEARRPDIQRYIVRQAASISTSQLIDFDYSVRLVMTSSTYHGDIYPVLLLKLRLSGDKEVTFELNQTQLDEVLTEFDKIEKTIASIESRAEVP